MTPMRLAALAFVSLPLVGCHDDPEVVTIVVTSTSSAFKITTCGGNASSTAGAVGTGGPGGDLRGLAFGDVLAGASGTPLSPPEVPDLPSTSGITPTASTIGDSVAGLLWITSLTTTADAAYTSTSGDLLVSGTLQAGDDAATQWDITLNAPNGTVFVTGTIRMATNDGSADGDTAGILTINASRIVILGAIEGKGENNPAGNGGAGSVVTLDTTAGGVPSHIFLSAGSINTTGGNGANSGGGALSGGAGGSVTITAGGSTYVFVPITTSGGSANDSTAGAAVTGGAGGTLTLDGASGVDLSSTVTMRGGAATGGATGAAGGAGGNFISDSVAVTRLYGTIEASGGDAEASGGAITGGAGGDMTVGSAAEPDRLELGKGTYSTCGGTGEALGGDAGDIELRSLNGEILCGSVLDARGGGATGPGPASGGVGGDVSLVADEDFGGGVNASNHPLTFLDASSIATSGGEAVGAGNGGAAGSVALKCGGDLLSEGSITAQGGATSAGIGGAGPASGVLLEIAASNASPNGAITLTGAIDTRGGTSTTGTGGLGGAIVVDADASAAGEIVSSAPLTTTGGDGGGAGGGDDGGAVSFFASGAVTTTGGWNADGGASTGAGSGGDGGVITIRTFSHDVSSGGDMTARGGASNGASGGFGGQVVVWTDADLNGIGGDITLEASGSINVSGGVGAAGTSSSARADAGGTVVPGGANVAVQFDAFNDLVTGGGANPDEGIVRNLGTIRATGSGTIGLGGDVYFDGRDSTGAVSTAPSSGSLINTGGSVPLNGLFDSD